VTLPEWTPEKSRSRTGAIAVFTAIAGGILLTCVAVIFARKNVRAGHGDRKGAFRLAAGFFIVNALSRLLMAHHVSDINSEYALIIVPVGLALLTVAVLWVYYIALEPYVRSRWPEYLISWTRVLTGKYRDSRVGRDLLAGCLFGTCLALTEHVINAFPAWFNLRGQTPINGDGPVLGTTCTFAGILLNVTTGAFLGGLITLFLFFIIRVVVRKYWAAVVVFGLLITLLNLGRENVIVETSAAVLVTALIIAALGGFGLLTLITAYAVQNMLQVFPVAIDPAHWYFARGFVPALLVLALLLYSFRTSFGGSPIFPGLSGEREG
jgi:hypothetical protein